MSLRRDTLWNVAGMGVPLLAAAAFIPFVLSRLGNEAFGVVTLIWALIGYFGLFDLGMGRALTFEISKSRAEGGAKKISQTLSAGVLVTAVAGIVGALALLLLAPVLTSNWLKISPAWQTDARLAFQIAALGVIPTTVTSGLRGALEGYGQFAASNIIRLFFGLSMFVFPAISVLLHGASISSIALYLVGARLLALVVGLVQIRLVLRISFAATTVDQIRKLFSYGFWVTVSGVVGPLMIYGDRFFVGAVVGADQLSYYAIPQEGLQRLLIIPGALSAALLPRFASARGEKLSELLNINNRRTAVSMFAVCLVAAILAHPILSWWLSPEFAAVAGPIVWVLAIGIWINSIAQLPYTLIHALGQPKTTAMFHLLELVFYFLVLYWFAAMWGLMGAAVAWCSRVLLDFILVSIASRKLLSRS